MQARDFGGAQARAFGQHVDHLSARHAPRARGRAQRRDEFAARLGVGVGIGFGQHLEGTRLQRVAREDRGRLVEGAVSGGLAAPKVVVVHGGQVIMHERIGVHHLDRCSDPRRAGWRDREQQGGLDHEEAPEPLASAQRGIAHRLRETRLRPFDRWQ